MLRAYLRRHRNQPWVRPWALATPIAVLLVCLPLLRPLRHPDAVSDDEQVRLATIQALAEHHTLALDRSRSELPSRSLIRVRDHLYSAQPPVLAFLLAGPYWLMLKLGVPIRDSTGLAPYLLTLLGSTIPATLAAGFVYRMGRLFELARPWRMGLAMIVVFCTGLISYAVVLNAHAPSAALVLLSAAVLLHVSAGPRASKMWWWLLIAGACASLAAVIDPPAVIFLILLTFVVPALRWRLSMRVAGVCLYLIGALMPFLLHARLTIPITGDVRPGYLHPELAIAPMPSAKTKSALRSLPFPGASEEAGPAPARGASSDDEDAPPPSFWSIFWRDVYRVLSAFLGRHGILTHFPAAILGVFGIAAVMHRHWPATAKVLASVTAAGAVVIILVYALGPADGKVAMFANRFFLVFLPLTIFWAGAWARRSHRPTTWAVAAALVLFSAAASLIGATDPYPPRGYDQYTVAGALHHMLATEPATPPDQIVVADAGHE